jgi:quercetin dioxygenase-like cupin family protein/hemerythrin-like domain-containing protein
MTSLRAAGAIEVLLGEHVQAMALFEGLNEALERATSGGGRGAQEDALDRGREVLAFLDGGLEVHIRKEEEPLFPRLAAVLPADDRLVEEMIAEHDQIRIRREQVRAVLDEMLMGADHHELRERRAAFAAALAAGAATEQQLTTLRRTWRAAYDTLRIHFENEEDLAFPLAGELISAAELEAAAREMELIESQAAGSRQWVNGLGEQLQGLLASDEVARTGRSARTLVKTADVRVVLIALGAKGVIQEHHAPGALTIQALAGTTEVSAGGAVYRLQVGDLLALPDGMTHALRATAAGGLLLTIALRRDGRGEDA